MVAYATHGVLSGAAAKNLDESSLYSLTTTDTIPLAVGMSSKVRHLSMANLLAETITRVHTGNSISEILE